MDKRIIVVTGAFGALGRAVVRRALDKGAFVAQVDVGEAASGAPQAEERSLSLAGIDLADAQAARDAFARINAHFGGIDALLNVAGGFVWQTVAEGDLAAWDRMFALNLRTAASACMAALPFLEKSGAGSIVNVGALGAVKAGAGMGAYAASKAGVAKLTESLAEELKGKVTVNAVLPSIIDTPANRAAMPDADFSKWVSPDDLAEAMLFLASTHSRAITGALLPVTGGV
ncbi:SDR family oxidoreductase [Rhodoblastus acidophilus]|uniref:SDR family oxidoreductase n=1 Tax=Candidatus Rhodoblastus alkanivorans TaxID=2954117 RepID=A0ABS9ZBD4_9HYPH|nr:SDR family NAD(P)-dependent oxidoreductase [Candidatus Rhodoblastus alkanivorans]MCI4679840.1 SDR family oxidoreductase [Candidatus Rhodoblastus alkanivorans]MCI4684346.1 SDR family oxidoreductase [Candidatus Rhodoblastus alkanivorans]MDI4641667.1 SDR family oxidoreductase [Rhodoblastus acidophilus]